MGFAARRTVRSGFVPGRAGGRRRIGAAHCPLDRLDAAQCAERGLLIRRALDLMSALKLAVHIGLDEIRGDEFCAMLIIAEERDLLEREKLPGLTCWRSGV